MHNPLGYCCFICTSLYRYHGANKCLHCTWPERVNDRWAGYTQCNPESDPACMPTTFNALSTLQREKVKKKARKWCLLSNCILKQFKLFLRHY